MLPRLLLRTGGVFHPTCLGWTKTPLQVERKTTVVKEKKPNVPEKEVKVMEIEEQDIEVTENAAKGKGAGEVNENKETHSVVKETESGMGVYKVVADNWLTVRFNRIWYVAKAVRWHV